MKIFKFIGKIFRWYFLGIGFICFLVFSLVKYIFFYIGSLLATIFYFIYSVFTLKFVRDMKNKKNEKTDSIVQPNTQKQTENKNPSENINQTENINQNASVNPAEQASVIEDLNNQGTADGSNPANVNAEDIPFEEELKVSKANFKAEAFDPNNQGNLGYHVFMENNNIASNKKEDILSVPNKEGKQIIKEGRVSKTAKSEEKIFKEIDAKQSFRERLEIAFPTLFENANERKKEREEAKQNKENNDDEKVVIAKEENTLGPKTVYEYTARDKNGKLVKNYYEAYSLVEVQSYLLSEGYDIYKIRTNQAINLFHRTANAKRKMKTSDMVFFLTQLSTYLKAGITLTEAVEILSRQFKNVYYQKLFKRIANSLKSGDNFSEALAKTEGVFPKLLVNMIKTSELTGDLPETLDDMADY